jgi:secreted trypsin-like serine protease
VTIQHLCVLNIGKLINCLAPAWRIDTIDYLAPAHKTQLLYCGLGCAYSLYAASCFDDYAILVYESDVIVTVRDIFMSATCVTY